MSFFVLGLPRSRTAWLSVFLSQSGTHCYHDGINGCKTMAEYKDKIEACGDSTTAFAYMDGVYINRPTVIIEKTDSEFRRCLDWCGETFGPESIKGMIEQRTILADIDGLKVNQSDIDSRRKEIFEHLTGVDFLDHYADLSKLRIESNHCDIDYESMRALLNV